MHRRPPFRAPLPDPSGRANNSVVDDASSRNGFNIARGHSFDASVR